MVFVLVGVLLLLLKWTDVNPVAAWAWWIVLLPFALAVAWWSFSDSMGITARKQSDRVEARAQKRRDNNLEAIGVSSQAIAAHRQAAKSRKALADRAKRMA